MNKYLYYDLTDIIEGHRIFVTYLTYLMQVTTDFPLHFFPIFFYSIRLMGKFFV